MKNLYFMLLSFLLFIFSGCLSVSFPIAPSGRSVSSHQIEIFGTYNTFNDKADSYFNDSYVGSTNKLTTCSISQIALKTTIEKTEIHMGIGYHASNSWVYSWDGKIVPGIWLFDFGVKNIFGNNEDVFSAALDIGINVDVLKITNGISMYLGVPCNYSLFRDDATNFDLVAAVYTTLNFESFPNTTVDELNGSFGPVFWLYGGFELKLFDFLGIKLGGGIYQFSQTTRQAWFTDYASDTTVQVYYTLKSDPFIVASVYFNLDNNAPVKLQRSEAWKYVETVEYLIRKKDYVEAKREVLYGLYYFSNNYQLNRLAGIITKKLKEPQLALYYLRNALSINPNELEIIKMIDELLLIEGVIYE